MSLNRFFSKRNPFESTGRGSPGFRMKGGRGSGSAGMGDGHLGTGGWQGGVGRVAGPMVVGMSSSVHHHHWVGQSRVGGMSRNVVPGRPKGRAMVQLCRLLVMLGIPGFEVVGPGFDVRVPSRPQCRRQTGNSLACPAVLVGRKNKMVDQ